MKTIEDYLNNMFVSFPKTDQVVRIHDELLQNMTDRFDELMADGHTESEAIATVIAEFGNIEELKTELGVTETSEQTAKAQYDPAQLVDYLNAEKKGALWVSLTSFFFIFSMAISIQFLFTSYSTFGVLFLFASILLSAIGFLIGGLALGAGHQLLRRFPADPSLIERAKQEINAYQRSFSFGLIGGIALVVFIPSFIIINAILTGNSTISSFAILLAAGLIGLGACLIIYVSIIRGSFGMLEHQDHRIAELERQNVWQNSQFAKIFESIFWPIIFIIFMVSGFFFHAWGYNWLLFVFGGIIQNVVIQVLMSKKK